MSYFEPLAQRLTQRLKVDPELRLAVARELRDHLEDSAEAFRRGGDSAQQAQASAIKALGDESEVAEGLWHANRWRIGLRAAAWWLARATLLPLAICLMLAFVGRGMLTMARVHAVDGGHYSLSTTSGPVGWLARREARAIRASLTEDERLIVYGDETIDDPVQSQRAIWERFDDEPMYYAHYIHTLLDFDKQLNERIKAGDPEAFEFIHGELDRGRRIEPQNGIYDIIHAALVLNHAVDLEDDESLSYELPDREGEMQKNHPKRLIVKDQAALADVLTAMMEAASKPYARSYAIEMELHRQAILPRPATLHGQMQTVGRSIGVLLPTLGQYRAVAVTTATHALALARKGQRREAERLIDAVDSMAIKLAADSRCAIELLVAQSTQALGLRYRALVYELLDDNKAAREAHDLAVADANRFNDLMYSGRRLTDDQLARAGTYLGVLLSAAAMRQRAAEIGMSVPRPWRMRDHAVSRRNARPRYSTVGPRSPVPWASMYSWSSNCPSSCSSPCSRSSITDRR